MVSEQVAPGHLLGVSIGLVIVSAIVVAIRLFTRVVIIKNAGTDDACLLTALMFSIAVTVTMIGQLNHGLGKDVSEISPQDLVTALKYFWASIWLYNLTICFTKVSIVFQYLRIWSVQRGFRIICYAVLGFIISIAIWTVFGSVWLCAPARKFWDPSVSGTCQDKFPNFFANAGLSIVTDLILIIMPMPFLKSLRLPIRQKIAVMFVFALGSFVCIVSFIRLRYLSRIAHSKDPTRDNVNAATWSVIEINVGIVCASLPPLKAFLSRIFPGLMASNFSASTNNEFSGGSSPMPMREWRSDSTQKLGARAWVGPTASATAGDSNSNNNNNNNNDDNSGEGEDGLEMQRIERVRLAAAATAEKQGNGHPPVPTPRELEKGHGGGGDGGAKRINVVTVVEQEVEDTHSLHGDLGVQGTWYTFEPGHFHVPRVVS
ncbi:hypothetical protein MBLNU459_g0851t1 [Dothideomycetes sp. NU459]